MALQQPSRDRHVRRSGDDYAQQLLTLLPSGQAWPKWPGSTLERTITGLATYYGFVDGRAGDLLERESDPRKTIITTLDGEPDGLLPDWEQAFGLPDPCFQEPLTIADRQRVLVQRITLLGAQSRAWFIEVSLWLGYHIRIGEYAPWMVGISRCGATPDEEGHVRWEIAHPEIRFYWKVHVDKARLSWFRCGSGECGVDPHLIIGLATDLECVLNRWKPAHTLIIYDYSLLATGGSMAGTP
jgi:uncharacterized protein YmfQ (DUF2313 family)